MAEWEGHPLIDIYDDILRRSMWHDYIPTREDIFSLLNYRDNEAELKEAHDEVHSVMEDLNLMEQERDDLKMELGEERGRVATLRAENNSLTMEVENLKAHYALEIDGLRQDVEDIAAGLLVSPTFRRLDRLCDLLK